VVHRMRAQTSPTLPIFQGLASQFLLTVGA